ncbi:aminopeptidase [Marinobacter sp. chi1]|uniref:Aminopeptidase n=1 Tax=Marinobacter suaedae TaxID=3057675 RepID=A0ABT8VYL5_9GAMM|nr:aminopeptidase [Marinobacter sp. chi1]MDO3721092.1 aminopeptidase [Marinobacter sp. chi1]
MNPLSVCIILLIFTFVSGCSTVAYYAQAIGGHTSLMMSGDSIDDLIDSPATETTLRNRLVLVQQARKFARDGLSLPVGDAFTDYVELEHPWVVVNLVAVPEFSLSPHQWCYPVLGCQAYRGYFQLEDARREQRQFDQSGYDTLIGGVTAYSTLGWFDDPLHSGFIALPEERMLALMFHELAHRVVYIGGDTAFNESFATAVELEGLALWVSRHGNPEWFERAKERLQQREQTLALVKHTTSRLDELYRQAGQRPDAELRAEKTEVLDQLLAEYDRLSEQWQQPGPFGTQPESLNNANLALFRQYNQYVDGFRQLLRDHDYDFPAFYDAVATLGALPEPERQQQLTALVERFEEHL